MKRWFESLPVHQKLIALALGVSTAAVIAAVAALAVFDVARFRESAEGDARTVAAIIAENISAAMVFEDPAAAAATLQAVGVRPTIVLACAYQEDGSLLAGFARADGRPCPSIPTAARTWRFVSQVVVVRRNGEEVGRVFVERALSDLRARVTATAAAGVVVILLAVLIAFPVAQALQRLVSRPIVSLAHAARRIGRDQIFEVPDIVAPPSAMDPLRRTDNLFTAFAHDDIKIVGDRLRVSVGTKVEHNAYSGFEVQPSARLLWAPAPSQTVFAAVTRAVRVPSRVEVDYTTTSLAAAAGPVFVRLLPNKDFRPEELVAYELGYRTRPLPRTFVTASGFFNQYDHLIGTEGLTPLVEPAAAPIRVVIPVTFANTLSGQSHGVELTADSRPLAWLRSTVNYSYLRIAATRKPGSRDVSQEGRYEGLSPNHQLQFQFSADLPGRWTVDYFLRHISALALGPVPGYSTSTLRLAWQVTPRVEVAAVGQDLNQARHREWSGSPILIQRNAYLKVTIR